MFKEQLKKDIDMISPAPELLDRISAMMREESEKPRVKPYISVLKYAGMAAAVFVLAFGAVRLGMKDNAVNTAEPADNSVEMYAEPPAMTTAELYKAKAEEAGNSGMIYALESDSGDAEEEYEEEAEYEPELAEPSAMAIPCSDGEPVSAEIPAEQTAITGDAERVLDNADDIPAEAAAEKPIPEPAATAAPAAAPETDAGIAGGAFAGTVNTAGTQSGALTSGALSDKDEENVDCDASAADCTGAVSADGYYYDEYDDEYEEDDDDDWYDSDEDEYEGWRIWAYPRNTVFYGLEAVRLADRPVYSFEAAAERIARSDDLSLYRMTFTARLTEDEKAELPYDFEDGYTYYRVLASEMGGEAAEMIAAFSGTETEQYDGSPIYQEGDTVICEGRNADGIIIIREYPLCDVYMTPAGEAAYMRIQGMAIPGAEDRAGYKFSLTTTTQDNPAVYYGIYSAGELEAAFIAEIRKAENR